MMRNLWVRASLTMGVSIGLWLGTWAALIHPAGPLIAAVPFGIWSAMQITKARGTNGRGGPYRKDNSI